MAAEETAKVGLLEREQVREVIILFLEENV